jgi:hypothetical protein
MQKIIDPRHRAGHVTSDVLFSLMLFLKKIILYLFYIFFKWASV